MSAPVAGSERATRLRRSAQGESRDIYFQFKLFFLQNSLISKFFSRWVETGLSFVDSLAGSKLDINCFFL